MCYLISHPPVRKYNANRGSVQTTLGLPPSPAGTHPATHPYCCSHARSRLCPYKEVVVLATRPRIVLRTLEDPFSALLGLFRHSPTVSSLLPSCFPSVFWLQYLALLDSIHGPEWRLNPVEKLATRPPLQIFLSTSLTRLLHHAILSLLQHFSCTYLSRIRGPVSRIDKRVVDRRHLIISSASGHLLPILPLALILQERPLMMQLPYHSAI